MKRNADILVRNSRRNADIPVCYSFSYGEKGMAFARVFTSL
jgi:hypothetical protein